MKKSTLGKVGGALSAVLLTAALLLAVGVVSLPMPQRGPPQKDMQIDAAMRTEVIERLIADLNAYYVFPDQARAMENALRSKQKRGDYEAISSAEQLAATLTADIQEVSHDRHLDVAYLEAIIPSQAGEDADAPTPERLQRMRQRNFGVEQVARLDFNIGYLD